MKDIQDTVLVDLKPDEEEIISSFVKSARCGKIIYYKRDYPFHIAIGRKEN